MPDPPWVTPRADPDAPAAGGSSAQVFEVTDLPIPIDTDWTQGHVLQTFDVPAGLGACTVAVDLELGAIPGSDVVEAYLRPVGVSSLPPGVGSDAPDTMVTPGLAKWSAVETFTRGRWPGSEVDQFEFVILAADSTYNNPTTELMAVVYARVAFLVL